MLNGGAALHCHHRLGRQRDSGAPGFGNARSVRNLLEQAISRQSARVIKERKAGEWGAVGGQAVCAADGGHHAGVVQRQFGSSVQLQSTFVIPVDQHIGMQDALKQMQTFTHPAAGSNCHV
jgi:hypothetical protein